MKHESSVEVAVGTLCKMKIKLKIRR